MNAITQQRNYIQMLHFTQQMHLILQMLFNITIYLQNPGKKKMNSRMNFQGKWYLKFCNGGHTSIN